MTRTTYLPPASADQLPRTVVDWKRITGLTDPSVLAAAVRRRVDAVSGELRYADFFRTR